MRTRLAALACLLVLVAADARAALVDAQYEAIKDTAVATVLTSALQMPPPADGGQQPGSVPGAAPQAEPAAGDPAADPLAGLNRILVGWEGVRSPPVIRFVGLDAAATVTRLSAGKEPTATAIGPSYPLPNLPGFCIVAVGERELVVSTPAALEKLQLPPLPPASGHALQFTGPASDLKLGELQDKLKDFHLTYDSDGVTRATLRANNEKDAKKVDRWVWWRKPLVYAGADLGVKKLKFPAKLLDQTEIARSDDALIATTSLKDDLKLQAFQMLADQIKRECRRFAPKG